MTLEELYQDLHSHPELAFAEHRTAGIAAEWLAGAGYTVTTGIGGTGVAGVLRNGDGPTALVRADMDALRCARRPASTTPATWSRPTPAASAPRSCTPAATTCT
jgi:metal-dependent amidase/aminoacylase/carboxypeptidase family protein